MANQSRKLMIKLQHQLENLFTHYIEAFKVYDMSAVRACYHLPCSLHTPDKIAYLNNEQDFSKEFEDIFIVLKHGGMEKITVTAASYNVTVITLGLTLVDVCIDWAFFERDDELFADFSAYYQVLVRDEELKIVSVVSHALENSVALANPLHIAPCDETV